MARLNISLPDDLAAAAEDAELDLSAVTQEAVRGRLAARSTDAWLATLPSTQGDGASHSRSLGALDDIRVQAPTRHG